MELEKLKLKCGLICAKSSLLAISFDMTFQQYSKVEEKEKLKESILEIELALEELKL